MASVALPRLTAQVSKARAAEAFNVLGVLMGKISECYSIENTLAHCNSTAEITTNTGYTMPTSTNFTYAITAAACTDAGTSCAATATPVSAAMGSGVITFTINLSTGAVTKTGTNDYAGLIK